MTGGRLYRLRWGCVISNELELETLTRPGAESCVSCDNSRVRYNPVDTILDIESLSRGSSLNLCNFPEYLLGSGSRWRWYQYCSFLWWLRCIHREHWGGDTGGVTDWRLVILHSLYSIEVLLLYWLEWNLAVVLTDLILWTSRCYPNKAVPWHKFSMLYY